jgi:alpha-L-fucosidase
VRYPENESNPEGLMSSLHNRRTFLGALGTVGAAATLRGALDLRFAPPAAADIPGPSSYSPSWQSVDQHPPAAEWFQDAKFGIYFHWGAFSVPAFENEWYPRNMYNPGSGANNHHRSVYGEPAQWPYHNFINGARDRAGNFVQFAPKLPSAGGNFDPAEWAQLFADAGARFAGPVAEHHDGFSMWNSSVNEWNSVDRGPRPGASSSASTTASTPSRSNGSLNAPSTTFPA